MKDKTLNDLYLEELRDIYDAENQLLKALPKLAKAAHSDDLRSALEEHRRETETHVSRLDQIFEELDARARGNKCEAMAGLIDEGKEIMREFKGEEVIDAGIICAAQKVEHYEMAGYGCLRTYAEELGHSDQARLLLETLEEEKAADHKLTELAKSHINHEALAAA